MLANIVGPTGRVIAVEPEERFADLAQRNAALNRYKNITVVHAAVGAKSGELVLTDSGYIERGESGEGKTTVKAVTVDDLASEYGYPDVLFIDVEGYECEVLCGATKTLEHFPDMFIEVHVGVGLEAFGYSVTDVLRYVSSVYDVTVAPPHAGDFQPLAQSSEITQSRFFLVARQSGRPAVSN